MRPSVKRKSLQVSVALAPTCAESGTMISVWSFKFGRALEVVEVAG